MSLEIVFGSAGSGKSTVLQKEIIADAMAHPLDNYILIVPDQFTMQTQMDIVKRHPKGGIMNVDVLSFSRLSYRVFQEAGKPDIPVLDDTGKSLVLRHVASKVSENMPYIGKNLNKVGYIHEVKSAISEFMQYGIGVRDLEKMAEKASNTLLKHKLNDLSVIYSAFCEYNRDKFLTSEETLDLLCNRLEGAEFIKGATVVFDGFTGFTPVQERVVLKLMQLAGKVVVSFTLSAPEKPSDVGGEEKLFYLSRKSAGRLRTMAKDNGIECLKDRIIDGSENGRFCRNAEFMHLEKNLFRFPYKTYEGKPENISVYACDNIENEVSETCLRIHELIRSGKYAYRDIAIVVGSLDTYGASFEARMRELDMPCFIDRTSAIILNPFTEFLKSALLVIIRDYSYDSVLHFLRTGFTSYSGKETDRFDRYISSLNIRGRKAYHNEFKKYQKGMPKEIALRELAGHEEMRRKLMEEFSILERPSKTAGDYVRNLYDFILNNASFEKLEAYAKDFEAANDLAKAREYSQIYRLIMELLDTIMALIGNEEMTREEFYRIFDAGISEIEVGTIPRNVDRIMVGDIERTRLNEVKALFFVGVNDGNIPKNSDKGGILSGIDREALLENGYELAPTPREEMYTQKLYLYMNLCKPTDKLFVSFSGTDTQGKGLRPSYLVGTLLKLFKDLQIEKVSQEITRDKFSTRKDSLRLYAGLIREYALGNLSREAKLLTEALLSEYRKIPDFILPEKVTEAAFTEYVASPLSKEIIRLIYGSTLQSSISRMESFAQCSYRFFLQYGMSLKELEAYEITKMDLGTIYHGVLDAFSSILERKGISWTDFTAEQCVEFVSEAVKVYCEEYAQNIFGEDEQTAYLIRRITDVMIRTVDTLQFQLKRGHFVQVGHELTFEREVPLEKVNAKMRLKGKVDRIDLCEEDGRIYVKIIDYKSSAHSLDITDIYYGLSQQLVVYMNEAVKHEKEKNPDKTVLPVAMLYYEISNPMINASGRMNDEAIESEIRKKLKLTGMVENSQDTIAKLDSNAMSDDSVIQGLGKKISEKSVASGEELQGMMNYVERLTTEIGERIYEGNIDISPMKRGKKSACDFCNYRSICRFDEKIPGYRERNDKKADADEIRAKVMGGDSDGLYLFD